MLVTVRTQAANPDFRALVKQLDAYLATTDGDEHAFYDQYNQLDEIKYVIVAYRDRQPIGCGAIKEFSAKRMEVKRMWVDPRQRGRGDAAVILQKLEDWAKELGAAACVLETGRRQFAAVKFYRKCGYREIPNYGQYQGMENSICFEKPLH